MSEEIKGKCYQEHEPTPNNPCEIKTILCNDIEIPVEFLKQNFVTVDGKKYIELQQENQQLKEVIEEARENINELIEHYKRLLNAEYNQEISVFVDKTHKNMFISNVVSSLEVMKICILDKAGDNNV